VLRVVKGGLTANRRPAPARGDRLAVVS
jgi:hypothetical protein